MSPEAEMSSNVVGLLAEAFADLLGHASTGSMAFCRCLRPEVVMQLAANGAFHVPKWAVFAVAERVDKPLRLISSDLAVELREDKGEAVLLLINSDRAGAGMDGIYSAAREIHEEMLFDRCRKLTRQRMDPASFSFADLAIKRARQVGQGKAVSRWQECEFLAEVASDCPVGEALAALGLWPIQHADGVPREEELNLSGRLVERLILGAGEERTPATRVRSLLLIDPTPQANADLEAVVRYSMSHTVSETLHSVVVKPHLWLNAIQPGFLSQQIQKVELRSWRLTSGKLAKWSGLQDGDTLPQFLLPVGDIPTAKQPKLEVRFDTVPSELPKGSVEYRVSVRSGDDELAYREVSHQSKGFQTVRLTAEDFQDLLEDSQFEAQVRVEAVSTEGCEPSVSEEFILRFGEPEEDAPSSNARWLRTLVEGAIEILEAEQFDEDCQNSECYFTDAKGLVGFRQSGARISYKVHRPPLMALIEEMSRDIGVPGRWSVRVRRDGTRLGAPQFHPFSEELCSPATWDKLTKVSQRLKDETSRLGGFWGRIYACNLRNAEDYVNAWSSAFEEGHAHLPLVNTIEVQGANGATVGLLVLPSNPIRVAWQMAFDQLARHARYDEGLKPKEVQKALQSLDSASYPAILPGLRKDYAFIFADTLGFYAVAMVKDSDPEPKAAVAQMMACMGNSDNELKASISKQASACVAREVSRYVDFHSLQHETSGLLKLHALRPGDGQTVIQALGGVINSIREDDEERSARLRFHLELFPANPLLGDVTGGHLRNIAVRHRTGAAGISNDDRWTLQSEVYPGNLLYPKLHWAQRDERLPAAGSHAHLTVAFDTFNTCVTYLSEDELGAPSPLHVYGLIASQVRTFTYKPEVKWESWYPAAVEGAKHPAGRVFTDRLIKVHRAALKAAVANSGAPRTAWPVLRTSMMPEQQDELQRIHDLSDWVVTIDRNAGVEFFDSPRDARGVFDAYVIDCVPERADLGTLQMITSTTRTEEVRELLDSVLASMGLSASLRNCTFLIDQLKGLSGRLAMRLTTAGNSSGELIALAMVYANCSAASATDHPWLSLSEGFFVPIDDVRDLAPGGSSDPDALDDQTGVRADLIYVSSGARGGLTFTFVEVKYRRHLRMARDNQLLEDIAEQAETHCTRWHDWYFDERVSELSLAVRRSQLVRALRFYADKAARHTLTPRKHEALIREFDKLMLQGAAYRLGEPAEPTRGYVFSPEMSLSTPEKLVGPGTATSVYLFGPSRLPDLVAGIERPQAVPVDETTAPAQTTATEIAAVELQIEPEDDPGLDSQDGGAPSPEPSSPPSTPPPDTALVNLGTDKSSEESVAWSVSSRANPHLMIVGLPGMGKTEALLNICNQLISQSITPIVFSYHPDIDKKLTERLGSARLLDHQDLGFNPMHIDVASPHAHIDSAGMLRDIFAALFTDLGDVQLERIRQAIKQAYTQQGWGGEQEVTPPTPDFRQFYTLLQADSKPDKNLLARLNELDDYGVFQTNGNIRSLLEAAEPSVIRIHATQNEMVQRATAMLALYNIYKEMFRRGVQPRITHAIVFDEAHRASRLRLLPTLAVECRKFGLSLILASQSARDFDTSLFSGIASYLLLRMTEQDAVALARNITTSDQSRRVADRLKQLDKYHALFFREGRRHPSMVALSAP